LTLSGLLFLLTTTKGLWQLWETRSVFQGPVGTAF